MTGSRWRRRPDRSDRVDPDATGLVASSKPHIAPETEIISKGGKYPTAMLVVFKLHGDFDPAEVIKHANADAQLFENFKQLDASTAPISTAFPRR